MGQQNLPTSTSQLEYPTKSIMGRLINQCDLLICIALLLFTRLMAEWLPASPIHWLLGSILLLFVQGYILSLAVFPGRKDVDHVERMLLSVVLSVVTVTVIALMLSHMPTGVTLNSLFLVMMLFDLTTAIIAWSRRSKLPPRERFSLCLGHRHRMKGQAVDQLLFALTGGSIFLAAVVLFMFACVPWNREKFTEFYILGPSQELGAIASRVIVNEPIELALKVTSHEQDDVEYRIEQVGPSGTKQIASIQLAHGQTWEQIYTFTLNQTGANQKVEFLLYKQSETEPYRSLHLWMDVISN